MPLSRLWGFWVRWVLGYDEKGGALLSIAAPSMPCEANRPLTSHSDKETERDKGNSRPGIYDASVSFYGNNPPHGKLAV